MMVMEPLRLDSEETLFIDFDSTFVSVESIDELAALVLDRKGAVSSPKDTLAAIQEITILGMGGKIPFPESLARRLALIKAHRSDLPLLITVLKQSISPSISRNKDFFVHNQGQIYIISGGFKEFILPVVALYGIADYHVLANTFCFAEDGTINGFDSQNPLAQAQGKCRAVAALGLHGKISIIGDGYTDYELKKQGIATTFYAFTENCRRDAIIALADHILPSFDAFIALRSRKR
ncbi:haloacid dehalogenase-like hydrolase [Candidatus Woesearchaeota archaeon]|nr:haloacid dehalogenase-like hydrolase [Candidatus Woesearchaeota archaeon]